MLVDGQGEQDEHAFTVLHEAHFCSVTKSSAIGRHLHAELARSEYERLLSCEPVLRVPFAPLRGVARPALGIEIALAQDEQWQSMVQPLAKAIAVALSVTAPGTQAQDSSLVLA